MRLRHVTVTTVLLCAALMGVCSADSPNRVRGPDALSRLCEFGTWLAMSGREAAAESVFVALLSRAPGDARALNNLGNLHLRRGDPDLALEFYRRAGEADSADAGIALNAALALSLVGEEEAARAAAEDGVRRAGGLTSAADLLGLSIEAAADSTHRGAERGRMSRDRALELLRSATRAVPTDTVKPVPVGVDSSVARRRALLWRPAGARGSDAALPRDVMYWKR